MESVFYLIFLSQKLNRLADCDICEKGSMGMLASPRVCFVIHHWGADSFSGVRD